MSLFLKKLLEIEIFCVDTLLSLSPPKRKPVYFTPGAPFFSNFPPKFLPFPCVFASTIRHLSDNITVNTMVKPGMP